MSPWSVSTIPDMDKTREQLLAELQELRARNALLERAGPDGPRDANTRDDESMTRLLLEQRLYGVWVNMGGRVAYINEAGALILGASRPAEVVGKSVLEEIIHPDYRDMVGDRIKTMAGGGSDAPLVEEKFLRVDGSAVDVDVWAMSFIYHGEPAILVAFKDITERKQAVEALRQSEAKFRQMAENIGEVFFSFTRDWKRTIYVSPAYGKVWGRPVEDVYRDSMAWLEGVHPDDRGLPLAVVNRYVASDYSGTDSVEFRVQRPDGSIRWVLARTYPIRDESGDVCRITGIAEDITERKRAEEALRESEANLARAQAISHTGSWYIDPVTEVGSGSEEFFHILGIPRQEAFPYSEWFKLIHPDDRAKARAIFDRNKHAHAHEDFDFRIIRPDGEERVIFTSGEVVPGKDGKPRLIGTIQDITERKRIEREFRLTQFSVEKASDEIFWMGSDGRAAYVNDAACRVLGYSREELLSMYVWDWDPVFSPDRWREYFIGLREKGFENFETLHRTREGRVFPVEITADYVEYAGKEYSFAFVRDITERKQFEEALKFTQFALDNFRDSAIWITKDGRIIYVNKAACQGLGYSREELLSMHIWDVDPDYFQEKFLELWPDKRHGGHMKFESKHVARDGRAFPVEVTSNYMKYGDKEYLITFDRDITERRRAEEALRESEGKFRVVAETSPAAIFLYQGEKYVYVNPMAETLTGYSRDELMAGDTWEWIHPEFKDLVKDRARERQKGKPVPSQYEVKYRAKDGREGWVDFSADVIEYGGKPAGLATAFDVTERRRAEEELKSAKQQAELYLDLMAHDINNMHQVALGYLELAKDMPPGGGQTEFLDKPVEVLQRSTKLIDNVRMLQKFREGAYEAREVDVCGLLVALRSEYGAVSNKTVTLNLNGHEHCTVLANELLHDVYANLVNNAVKHTGDRAEITVRLDLVEDGGKSYCRVAVEDNGPGIPDEAKERIFNRMHMGSARGMGLGLYIVRTLVNSYGGRVWAEDRVKGDHTKGARFVVMLPAIEK